MQLFVSGFFDKVQLCCGICQYFITSYACTPLYGYTGIFVYQFISLWTFELFLSFIIVNNSAMNICM